ncbi:CCR4-NOT transcription complex subunit 8 isoform X1 [Macrotis lagotis]|uniref:CCR4-NOT transcription complex subunit 8 isoform X1 n=1 Tax=Macrotis lagotis TaxID=92651 RepID=UPI003D68A561
MRAQMLTPPALLRPPLLSRLHSRAPASWLCACARLPRRSRERSLGRARGRSWHERSGALAAGVTQKPPGSRRGRKTGLARAARSGSVRGWCLRPRASLGRELALAVALGGGSGSRAGAAGAAAPRRTCLPARPGSLPLRGQQAQDTEFPGVVVRPIGEFRSSIDYQYQLLRCNVDLLKIIQLGLTFTNEKGEYPSGINTWQFNFKFNLTEDMYSQDSIDLLANSGLQFQKHEEEGIDTLHFAELLMTSGVVLCDNVKWLSFHSGYDFGYMVKLLTDSRLPEEEHEFFHILNLFFPSIYDVKYLMKSCKNLKGGLQEVADQLDLQRIGRQHQAGSDSLLTGMAFFRMKELFFEDSIDDAKYCGRLYGLGTGVAQKQNEDVDSAQEKMSILAIISNMQQ